MRGAERVKEVREMLVTASFNCLAPCLLRLEQSAGNLESALEILRTGGDLPSADRRRCMELSLKLQRQVRRVGVLLDGWASFLGGWRQTREAYECGYTAGGTPPVRVAASVSRGEF
jgi:hypothetical protein